MQIARLHGTLTMLTVFGRVSQNGSWDRDWLPGGVWGVLSGNTPVSMRDTGSYCILSIWVILKLNPRYRIRDQEVMLRQDLIGTHVLLVEVSILLSSKGGVLLLIGRGGPLLQAQGVWGVRSFQIEERSWNHPWCPWLDISPSLDLCCPEPGSQLSLPSSSRRWELLCVL